MAVMSSVPAQAMILAAGRDDSGELLERAGIDPAATEPSLIDADAFYSVLELIVADGDQALPYRYGRLTEVDRLGVMGMALKTADSLRTALERAVRYIALLGDAVHYELRDTDHGGATFIIGGRPASRPGVALANEGAVAAVLAICRQIAATDAPLDPQAVSFAHRAPTAVAEAEAYFGCPVGYGAAFDGLHLDRAFLETATRLADAAISEYLVGRLDDQLKDALAQRGLQARVRHVIANGLADGVPPMRVVAGRLGLSERTLHRRLGDEGLRYQDLVVDVRQTVATALLTTTDHPLVDIAFLTGFSEQSAFQRAFKRWTGRTPLEVRRG